MLKWSVAFIPQQVDRVLCVTIFVQVGYQHITLYVGAYMVWTVLKEKGV